MSDRFAPGSTRQERANAKLLVLDYGLASVSRWIIKMPGLSGRLSNARQPTTKWFWPPPHNGKLARCDRPETARRAATQQKIAEGQLQCVGHYIIYAMDVRRVCEGRGYV